MGIQKLLFPVGIIFAMPINYLSIRDPMINLQKLIKVDDLFMII